MVTFGVVLSVSNTRKTNSSGHFFRLASIGTLRDGPLIEVLLFTDFGSTFKPGKVVVLVNPNFGSRQSGRMLTFSVFQRKQLRIVADAQDYGICTATLRVKQDVDGRHSVKCHTPYDTGKGNFCPLCENLISQHLSGKRECKRATKRRAATTTHACRGFTNSFRGTTMSVTDQMLSIRVDRGWNRYALPWIYTEHPNKKAAKNTILNNRRPAASSARCHHRNQESLLTRAQTIEQNERRWTARGKRLQKENRQRSLTPEELEEQKKIEREKLDSEIREIVNPSSLS
jgi:hypothetical protein